MDLIPDISIFLVASIVVIISALGLVKTADAIATQTGWGRVWVGSLLLGGATSLPELVTVSSAVHFLQPIEGANLALGTVFGANMMNVSKLTLIIALLGGRDFFQLLSSEQKYLAGIALTLTIMTFFLSILGMDFRWLFLSPATLIILFLYFISQRFLMKWSSNATNSREIKSGRSLKSAWSIFLLSAIAVFASAPFLAISASNIANHTGFGESFIGVLGVALVTSLPELASTIAAIRIKAPDLAVATIYGTNAFNIAILGVADMFYTSGSIFGHINTGSLLACIFAMLLAAFGTIQVMLKRPIKHFSLFEPSTFTICSIWVIGIILIFNTR
jgi:cation:H+ antiporter